MKEIYNGETVALGGVNLVTKQVVVDDSTGERANFTYDKTTGSITVLDSVDPDSVNPVTARAVAQAVAGASGEVPIIGDNDNGKVLKAVVSGGQKSAEWGEAAPAVTVDQTYNALSANPQSGTAVAQAIASVPSPVVTASGSFKLEGSVPVKVNYTGSPGYDRGPLQLVKAFIPDVNNYVVAVFKVVGSQSIYEETFGRTATLTINEPMYIADTGISTLAISFMSSDSNWSNSAQIYRDSFTRTDGKIDAQSINFWSISPYATGPYIGVGIIPQYGPNAAEKMAEVLQQLANGAVSISNWPVEEVMVTTMPNIPASTSADENKVLTVNAQGAAEWANSPVNADTTNKIIHFGPNLQAAYYDGGSQSVPFDLNMSQNGDYVVMEFSLPQHQNFNPNGVVFTIDSDFTVGSLYTDGQAYDCYKILADSTPATDGSGFMFADPATGPTSGKACRGTYTISSGATLVNVLTLKIRFNSSDDAASGYTRILNNWSSHVQVQSTYSTYSAQFVPAFTSADSGKVLQVQNDGTLAWVTLS